ncbi:S9 family peptidase [Prauserella cavernicola]|uniref:S9 family peptidase n=1 Tax=Prauserella cavernicola TaxID=2800127 RepID=A0A934V6T8_9PSEU|nr:S9 family peptidase [Prauserella cavernicola]MBK1787029.1 S9 family peptidase [Prauserella cavernicola]
MATIDPYSDLDAFAALPRLGELALSPDGHRLVVGVSTPERGRHRYSTALWELDPSCESPARRLTRSDDGESAPAFTPSGDLLFLSARPGSGGDPDVAALWLQPAAGGDARVVAALPGGVTGVVVGADGTLAAGSAMLPSASATAEDRRLRAAREDAGVAAILHEQPQVRFWDRDLGPARTRLFAASPGGTVPENGLGLRDLTGHVGSALASECTWDLTPDGRTVVTAWAVPEPGGSERLTLVAIDIATGERTTLADDPDHDYAAPRVSPDGTLVAVEVRQRFTIDHPGDRWLGVLPLDGGDSRVLARDWDRWPKAPRWTPDGTALIVVADEHGRAPLWRVDLATGRHTRLTPDHGAYTDLAVAPDGHWGYALRSAVDSPPAPVRVALDGSGTVQPLLGPAEALGLSVAPVGRLEEVSTTAADGATVRAWLALPDHADEPLPLLLQIHGGPVMSANVWTWRWNPWVLVARGYAVLMPDYALSTGYGTDFIRRGWGEWGGTPYTDLMSITDAVQQRPDIDASRSAAIGASYGGYMVNWIAGHTDRFDAIVTLASIWAMDQTLATTDTPSVWAREMTARAARANSPHRFADAITTPMLVGHGDLDYRVPIGEGLRLWWDLASRSETADMGPHKFLYFPDEGHWILKPSHSTLWYETMLAFLDHHVLGREWRRPALLG